MQNEDGGTLTAPSRRGTIDAGTRILLAAEAAFMADGFHVATMDAIARRAGCSKKTIYKLFASKEDLFFGLLERGGDRFCEVAVDRAKPPELALVEFLEGCARLLLAPRTIGLIRMMMAEYTHSPALLATAERRGQTAARFALETYLEELDAAGRHDLGEPRQAAQMLIGLALGAFHHELLMGIAGGFPPDAVRDRIRRAVRIFLRGTARGENGAGRAAPTSVQHPRPAPSGR